MRNQFWTDILGEDQTKTTQGKGKTQNPALIGDAESNASGARSHDGWQHHADDRFVAGPSALATDAGANGEKAGHDRLIPVEGLEFAAQPDAFTFEDSARTAFHAVTDDPALDVSADPLAPAAYAGAQAYSNGEIYFPGGGITVTAADSGSRFPDAANIIRFDRASQSVSVWVDAAWSGQSYHYVNGQPRWFDDALMKYSAPAMDGCGPYFYSQVGDIHYDKDTMYGAKMYFGGLKDYLEIKDGDTTVGIFAHMGGGDDELHCENADAMPFAYFNLGEGNDTAVITGTATDSSRSGDPLLTNVVIHGGGGNDRISYENGGNAFIYGDEGDDVFAFSFGDCKRSGIADVWGGDGRDVFISQQLIGEDFLLNPKQPINFQWWAVTLGYAIQDFIGAIPLKPVGPKFEAPALNVLTMWMRQALRIGELINNGGHAGEDKYSKLDTLTYLRINDFDPREDLFTQRFENQMSHNTIGSLSVEGGMLHVRDSTNREIAKIILDSGVAADLKSIASAHGEDTCTSVESYLEQAILESIRCSSIAYLMEGNDIKACINTDGVLSYNHFQSMGYDVASIYSKFGLYDDWMNLKKGMQQGDTLINFGALGAVQGGAGFVGPDGHRYYVAVGSNNGDLIYGSVNSDWNDDGAEGCRAEQTDTRSTLLSDIFGLGGDDIILGTSWVDHIYGGEGNDQINGGGANDVIYGDEGNDIIYGGDGNDTIYGGGTKGADSLNSGWPAFDCDTIYGGAGDDVIYGDAGYCFNDWDFCNDTIYGGLGNDTINGGMGNDMINGGAGNDKLSGSVGNDTFVFDAFFGHDTIFDFQRGLDKIDLSQVAELDSWSELVNHLGYDTDVEGLGYCAVITDGSGNEIDIALAAGQHLAASDFIFA
ncbi:calcium-binding protein [Martelella sp. AD-3]|uniref:calcium-binding protein n=1 Tax=Martelella sp. AD-3 TaxID=686597 RepID=UPI000A497431|nr:calcium-binding protein [Martelella sp. AD-3]